MSDAPKKTRRSTGKCKATHADPLPRRLVLQLATPVDAPPKTADWQWEIQLDGYRMLARIDGEQVRLFTRNGHDWTSKLPRLQKAIQELKLGFAWLDGEIVIISERGRTDFQALQNALSRHRIAATQRLSLRIRGQQFNRFCGALHAPALVWRAGYSP